ncbi:pentapeptide repeat-containing protein [Achromobacter xylosoxidans]|uniref:pentapeptide repeat-containing protein n=1 Tax=Alcaligenes xylosoxydans xylosoxydans TaxID=85698 RepID=UPI001F5E6147|nr:pentapeptide repeat-containing protein [Achromobacter xylosoxidans]
MQAKDARARWQAEQLQLAGRRLLDAAKSMKMDAMPESPFGLTDEGFEDYRGITLAEAVRYLSIERVDLSDAVFKDGASINESEATRCKFERMDMRNVFVRRKFDSCSFVGAKLNGARLGGEFIGCDFSRSNLSRSFATDCKFVDCKFAGANLSGIHFISCVFEGCDFTGVKALSGSVARSRFVGGVALARLQGCITDGVVIR